MGRVFTTTWFSARVTIVAMSPFECELSESDEKELEEALAEIERGEYVDGRELLRELKDLPNVVE